MAGKETQGHKKMLRYFQDLIRSENFLERLGEIEKEKNKSNKANRKQTLARIYYLDQELLDCLIKIKEKKLLPKNYEKIVEMCRIYNSDGKQIIKPDSLQAYPVCINIHRETSKRDLLDFVEKKWNEVESLLENHGRERLKYRPRKQSQEIIDFIWENRKFPAKTIGEKLKVNFPDCKLMYYEISKIISLEKRRRVGNAKMDVFFKMLEKYEKLEKRDKSKLT
jgi:hypothetical protein